MDIKAYIESGILELYVAGQLSDIENEEVFQHIQSYPELLSEVLQIEAAVLKLTKAVSPYSVDFEVLKKKLNLQETKVVNIKTNRSGWLSYTGWAASIVLAGGLLWTLNTNSYLEQEIETVSMDKQLLELKIEDARKDLVKAENLLDILRDRDIVPVNLGGQGNFEESYAKVYWNKSDNTIYLDAKGLPNAPEGKVWQVWSLTLNPLTPTSLGTIDDFNIDDNKIFEIANANESQAFGITLEPAGGSDSPTMEQLHTLGVVNTQP